MTVERFSHVMHMSPPLRGRLREDVDCLTRSWLLSRRHRFRRA